MSIHLELRFLFSVEENPQTGSTMSWKMLYVMIFCLNECDDVWFAVASDSQRRKRKNGGKRIRARCITSMGLKDI